MALFVVDLEAHSFRRGRGLLEARDIEEARRMMQSLFSQAGEDLDDEEALHPVWENPAASTRCKGVREATAHDRAVTEDLRRQQQQQDARWALAVLNETPVPIYLRSPVGGPGGSDARPEQPK